MLVKQLNYTVLKKIIFHKLISKRILVQITSRFDSMFLNRSKFDVFIFADREMHSLEEKRRFVCWSMLDHSQK